MISKYVLIPFDMEALKEGLVLKTKEDIDFMIKEYGESDDPMTLNAEDLKEAFTSPYGLCEVIPIKEDWQIVAWSEEGEMRFRYRDGEVSEWRSVELPDDYSGDTFNELWIQCGDDCERAGLKLNEDERYDWGEDYNDCPCRWRSYNSMYPFVARKGGRVKAYELKKVRDLTDEEMCFLTSDPKEQKASRTVMGMRGMLDNLVWVYEVDYVDIKEEC